MKRTRIKLAVYVDLDPMPGTFHSAESAQNAVRGLLLHSIEHYDPMVSIESYDTASDRTWSEPVGEVDDSDILQFHFPATDVELYAQNRRRISENQGRLV